MDKVPTVFGFAVIISTVGSYQVWAYVINNSSRLSLASVACQRYWPHGVLHQKMRRSRNLQFLCSLWQLGFFLNVNFSSFKTPPGLQSVAKCFAASTQHSCLWKNETLKTGDTLYESIYSNVFFLRAWAHLPGRLFVQKGSIASA